MRQVDAIKIIKWGERQATLIRRFAPLSVSRIKTKIASTGETKGREVRKMQLRRSVRNSAAAVKRELNHRDKNRRFTEGGAAPEHKRGWNRRRRVIERKRNNARERAKYHRWRGGHVTISRRSIVRFSHTGRTLSFLPPTLPTPRCCSR